VSTVNDIREDIANHLHDPLMVRVQAYQLLEFINAASHDARSKEWLLLLDDETLLLASSTYEYDVPASFAYIHEVWLESATGGRFDERILRNQWRLLLVGTTPALVFDGDLFTITAGRNLKLVGHQRPTEYTASVAGVNEVQRVSHDGTGGTFTLSFGGQTTAAINWNASAADVKSALEALSSVVSVDASGGALPTAVEITFTDPGAQNVAEMTEDDSSLTGDTVGVTIATVTQGRLASGTGASSIDTGMEAFIRERALSYAARYLARLIPSVADAVAEGVVADEGARYSELVQESWLKSENLLQERGVEYRLHPKSRVVPGR
jgi:hypothetical protein